LFLRARRRLRRPLRPELLLALRHSRAARVRLIRTLLDLRLMLAIELLAIELLPVHLRPLAIELPIVLPIFGTRLHVRIPRAPVVSAIAAPALGARNVVSAALGLLLDLREKCRA